MPRIPSFGVAVLLLLLAAAGFADGPHGPNAVNVRLAVAAPGDGLGLDGLSDAEIETLLAEASSRAGYGGTIPEGFADAMSRVYDIAAEILLEREAASEGEGAERWKGPAVQTHGRTNRAYGLVAPRRDAQTIYYRIVGEDGDASSGTKLDRAKVELIRALSNLSGGGNPDLSNAYGTFASDLFEAAMLLTEEGAGSEAARYSVKIHLILGNGADATDQRTTNDEVWNQPLRGIGVTVEGSVAEVVVLIVPANPAASAIWGYGPEGSYRVQSIPLKGGPSGTTDRTSDSSVWNFHVWTER